MSRRSSALQPAEFNPPVGQSSTTTSSALQKVCCRPQASIPTLNRLIDASPAYQHGVLLPRRHAVELREHRPRQRLNGPGAWARHRRGRHRRRPLRCPRQVVSRVSRERSRARSAGCARMASQGATGGPEAGSGGVGPAGRWLEQSLAKSGPRRSCRGRPACWVRLLVAPCSSPVCFSQLKILL